MKKIIVMPNATHDPDYKYTKIAETALLKKGFQVFRYQIDIDTANEKEVFENAFAILVLGGDGTILNAAHFASRYDLPILAVNLGRLGYIAQLEKNDLDRIPDILSGDFDIEERAMLSIKLYRNNTLIYENMNILNDAVISKLNGRGIIEGELMASGAPIIRYRGDGIIASTATGSTAYSMSAGGPIIDPTLKIIEVTPLATHSLKARPIVFSDRHTLSIRICPANADACLTLDGETTVPLEINDCIKIAISEYTTKLIARQNDFCKILYEKMSDL